MAAPSAVRVRLRVDDGATVALRVTDGDGATFGADSYIPYRVSDKPTYDGPYDVVPRLAEQVLATADHVMADDLTVEGIPSYRTTNVGGGYTVTIAQD